MNIEILLDIVIIIWLYTIERRLKIIDKAFGPIGLVLERLYRTVFGKEQDNDTDD